MTSSWIGCCFSLVLGLWIATNNCQFYCKTLKCLLVRWITPFSTTMAQSVFVKFFIWPFFPSYKKMFLIVFHFFLYLVISHWGWKTFWHDLSCLELFTSKPAIWTGVCILCSAVSQHPGRMEDNIRYPTGLWLSDWRSDFWLSYCY